MGKKIVDDIDNMSDAAKATDRADDIADGINTIGKIDDVSKSVDNAVEVVDALKIVDVENLPQNSSDLIKLGWKEVTPEGMKNNTTSKMYEKDGVKIVCDEAVPNAEGFRGKKHYHILNPNSTSRYDYYLDRNGNPVPKNSKQSHIIP